MGNDGGGKNVKWIEGLRGIASFLVLTTHLTRGWAVELFSPSDSRDETPSILQLPIIRLPWQGRISVTAFAFLTGFVCALKPLRLVRAGEQSAALKTIAKSAFRRPPRLILPATIVLLIGWTLAQLGAFTVAHRCDSGWLREASAHGDPTFLDAVGSLIRNFRSVWTNGRMDYDDHQWAILPLLKCSMIVYVVLSATAYVKFSYRLAVYAIMYVYFYQDNHPATETFYMQCFLGMLLCDLSNHPPVQAFISSHRNSRRVAAVILTFGGLFLASYPVGHPDYAAWSRFLEDVARYVFPPDVDVGRRYAAVGFDMIAIAIFLSPTAKEYLSSPVLLWLGKHSFAVYLTHGTLLRTVLVWMFYGISGQPWVETKNEAGETVPPPWLPRRGPVVTFISIGAWIGLVYLVAHFWTTYVDSYCARLTQSLEKLVFDEDEKSSAPV